MRIVQVTSDWKWTGPASPMLELSLALRSRGHDVRLCCPPPPPDVADSLAARARAAGLAPVLEITRGRGVHWLRDRPDTARLRALLADGAEVVHTWHTRDHVLALRATRRRAPSSPPERNHPRRGRPVVVRSYRLADPIAPWPWNRWLFGPGSDGLVCVSPGAAERNRRLRGGRPTLGTFGGIDLVRFRPAPPDKAVRESLGLSPEHHVVCIVARAQRHRRFDLLLAAAQRWMQQDARARLLVVGRGTHIQETAVAPAERLGIAGRVVFAGYRTDDYVDVLRCADAFTFLVPGSDGSCRALLEAAACGLPAVTTARGALAEIVVDGRTGLVVEERPGDLADAWTRLFADASLRARLAAEARARAESHFSTAGLAEEVEDLYAACVRRAGAGGIS